jgi:uncharacterized protein (TIGR00730 family)
MPSKKEKNDKSDWLIKSYNNADFLNSPQARIIRVLSEMVEPASRFQKHRLWDTVVFFGSARTLSNNVARRNLREIEQKMKATKSPSVQLKAKHERAMRNITMSRYYEDAVALSERLTRWFRGLEKENKRIVICTGGGPGIMEAANRGAKKAGGRSVGLNISLPMEHNPNRYQTRELSFEFHYFFIRKFWFFYLAKALVVFPGGFGTLDEFFELLTIIQTEKSKKYMPVVLYGRDYWDKVINIDEMVKWGTISEKDLALFKTFDDVDSASDYLISELTKHYVKGYRRGKRGKGRPKA